MVGSGRPTIRRFAVPHGIVVWRGAELRLFKYPVGTAPRIELGGYLGVAIGHTYDHRGFLSTSFGNDAAEIGKAQSVWYRIQVTEGCHGMLIAPLGQLEQREFLLEPGTLLQVSRAEPVGPRWYLEARALPASG